MSKFEPSIDNYNNALKLLFSHPIMIESLIKGFVPQAWVKDLDFSTLRKENIEFITDDLRERRSDVIWSIVFKGQPIYIVCLIEFQTSIDKFMAIKVLTYIGLIYQDLIKQENRTLMDDKLPPVFSLVLYTGSSPWNAPIRVADCLSAQIPKSLQKYQPNIEYMILDVGRGNLEAYTLEKDNCVSSFFALETVSDITKVKPIVDILIKRLQGEQFDSLRRAFAVYINRVWKPRRPFAEEEFIDLNEVSLMLSERIEEWEKEKIQQGIEQGVQKSVQLLVKHKFPAMSEAFNSKLTNMPVDGLEDLLEKLIKAQTLEEILD